MHKDPTRERERRLRDVAAALGKGWTLERVRRELIATAPPGATVPDWLRTPIPGDKPHEQKAP